MSDAALLKAALRKEILAELRAISPAERARQSKLICARVIASEAWQRSRSVLLFSPMRSEPDIASLSALAEGSGKQIATIPNTVRVESELQIPFSPQVILVPGVAFSIDGRRLGRGGGFYDRLLAGRARAAFKIGIGFPLQVLQTIPHEEHDAILDVVISE